MSNSPNILEHMCRACMCKNQIFHSLCDEPVDNTLKIYEMFATTIPQVPIHSADELPKKICVACLNTLQIVHKFQQMCIASDTYMRSLLVSNKLATHSSIRNTKTSKQQEEIEHIAMAREKEKLDISLLTQDLHKSACSIKLETNDEAVSETTNDATDLELSDGDGIPLKKSGNLKLNTLVTDEFQNSMKYEVNDVEVQECDLNALLITKRLENKTVPLEHNDVCDDEISTALRSGNDSFGTNEDEDSPYTPSSSTNHTIPTNFTISLSSNSPALSTTSAATTSSMWHENTKNKRRGRPPKMHSDKPDPAHLVHLTEGKRKRLEDRAKNNESSRLSRLKKNYKEEAEIEKEEQLVERNVVMKAELEYLELVANKLGSALRRRQRLHTR